MNFFMLASQVNKQDQASYYTAMQKRNVFGFISTTTLSLRRLGTLKRREKAK